MPSVGGEGAPASLNGSKWVYFCSLFLNVRPAYFHHFPLIDCPFGCVRTWSTLQLLFCHIERFDLLWFSNAEDLKTSLPGTRAFVVHTFPLVFFRKQYLRQLANIMLLLYVRHPPPRHGSI